MNRSAHVASVSLDAVGASPRSAQATTAAVRRARLAERLVWVFPLIACVLAVALFAPRFAIDEPSLVDDWFSLTYAPTAVGDLLHGHYNSAAVDYGGRFRPAYAVLNYVQWPLVGSAESTRIPTFLGLVRLLLFMGAVGLLVVTFMRGRVARGWVVFAASAAGLLCVATQGMAYNFVRLGVAEPTAIAVLAFALVAIISSLATLLSATADRQRLRASCALALGYVLYLFGVYLWEASVAIALLLPGLYLWLSEASGIGADRLWRNKYVLWISTLMVLPLVHIVAEVASLQGRGPDAGSDSLLDTLLSALRGTATSLFKAPGTPVWPVVFAVVVVVCVRRARRGDRRAAVCLGMLAAGLLATFISNVTGAGATRYSIGWLVALVVSGAYLLTMVQARTRVLVVLPVVIAIALGGAERNIAGWLTYERNGADAIELASSAYATGCPVYLADFPGEPRMGLARVLHESPAFAGRRCGPSRPGAFVVAWTRESHSRPDGCRGGWRTVDQRTYDRLLFCDHFVPRIRIPTQDIPVRSPVRVVRLVEPTRFVPASSLHSMR